MCSFCKGKYETVFYFYFYCSNVRNFWNQLNVYLAEDLTLPLQTLQAAVFSFIEEDITESLRLYKHTFLIFKLYVYRYREKRIFNVTSLVNQIIKIKKKKKKEKKKKNLLYSEKRSLSIIKMMQNRSKICCLVCSSKNTNYWYKKLFDIKTGGREERTEGAKLYFIPIFFAVFQFSLLVFLQ